MKASHKETLLSAEEVSSKVRAVIAEFVGQGVNVSESRKVPLMAMGITSLQLLKLGDRLGEEFSESLSATFFFQYATPEAITNFFIEKITRQYYDWLYTIEFRAMPITKTTALKTDAPWIFFADKGDLHAEQFVKAMEAENLRVIAVWFDRNLDFKNNVLRSGYQEDVDDFFKEMSQEEIEGIIYFSIRPTEPNTSHLLPLNLKTIQQYHRLSCERALQLIKGLENYLGQKPPKLWFVHETYQDPENKNMLFTNPLSWLIGAIMMEHPEYRTRRIVLDQKEPLGDSIQHFIKELSAVSEEEQIYWVRGERFVTRLIRFQMPNSSPAMVLKEDASYVIVGGCGGLGNIGLYVAQWHIEHGAKHLLLLDPKEISVESQEFIRQLQSDGISITMKSFDVTQKELLEKALLEQDKIASIRGVTHVLGLLDDDKLIHLDWARFEEVLQYKIPLAWHLHTLSQALNLSLDHFILFSAIGSIMGPMWRSSRSVGNSFLSALAHYRRAIGLPALAIDWGPWGATFPAANPIFEINIPGGMRALSSAQGMSLMTHLYHAPIPEVVAVEIDWSKLLNRYAHNRPLFNEILSELGLKQSEILQQISAGKAREKQAVMKNYVVRQVRRLLFKPLYEIIDHSKHFSELGLDDLRLGELRQRIQFDFGENLSLPRLLFSKDSTVDVLSKELLELSQDVDLRSATSEEKVQIDREPLAIIGMACRFPGARNYQEFWENLVNKVDSVQEIPIDRWNWREIYGDPKTEPGKTNIKWGAFIEDVDKFDPLFFDISPSEAAYIDPQHRLFLQTAWEAMEDAGYCSTMLSNKAVGVYGGVSKNDYSEIMREGHEEIKPYISTGTVHSILTNRVSYIFNIHGPSESIDTACSSSLVALSHAVDDIKSGRCKMAFVGGVNAILSPTMTISHSRAGMLSSEGRCKTFDESADGYVRGEGVGVILIKPLRDAIKDGDNIHAVIRSVAVNHGGKSSALTAPDINSQAAVINAAMRDAGVNPESISFIEAHGTGTSLGDPVEIEGLKKAFAIEQAKVSEKVTCLIGCVKTNVGHCESAAGIVSIIKMALAMKHRTIPANLHFKKLNPNIHLEGTFFRLANERENWIPVDINNHFIKRRGGVSSFGMGGSNAHAILEEAPNLEKKEKRILRKEIFPLSAKKGHLRAQVRNFNHYLDSLIKNNIEIDFQSLAYTLQTGRDSFDERIIFYTDSVELLFKQTEMYLEGNYSDMESFPVEAKSWLNKEQVDWAQVWAQKPRRLAGLPTYPFDKLRCWFSKNAIESEPKPAIEISQRQKTENQLRNIIGAVLSVDPKIIESDVGFEEYGISSIVISEINTVLDRYYQDVSKTLFFKYRNLRELTEYFVEHYPNGSDATDESAVKERASSADAPEEEIAIIGLSGQFPLANSVVDYWENLKTARNCIIEIPENRWDYKKYYEAVDDKLKITPGKIYCKWGGFIGDFDKFDAGFFNISPKDAMNMDPQGRLFLQCVWSCMESAGYAQAMPTRVGVFVGLTTNNYQLLAYESDSSDKQHKLPIVNSTTYSVANRISYHLNFKGPSVTLDTACSSSLYALHLACQAIRNGDCSMAIAGGVNITSHFSKYIRLCAEGFLASDGLCHAFTEGGDGYVPGEGVCCVLLKPMSLAIKDKDFIYAVIKSTAVTQCGRTNGYAVPSPIEQTEAIDRALKEAAINPRDISYVEAHGTGTALGDPIEMTGLCDAFEKSTQDRQFCSIGSVKSNIGHLEAAAGVSQLIKVVLQLRNKSLVPSLMHGKGLNPNIKFEGTPFYLQQKFEQWDAPYPRKAGISSFGAGGTNVHAIVEEYAHQNMEEVVNDEKAVFIIPLSAKTDSQLKSYAEALQTFLRQYQDHNPITGYKIRLQDVAYTLQIGRAAMDYRLAFLASKIEDVIDRLGDYLNAKEAKSTKANFQPSKQDDPQLRHMAELWLHGTAIDWTEFQASKESRRIYLPGYSFAKEVYWPKSRIPSVAASPIEATATIPEPVSEVISESQEDDNFLLALVEATDQERLEKITEHCQREVAKLLGHNQANEIKPRAGFFDLGMESIQTLQLLQILSKQFNVELPGTVLFDYPTILKLSRYLATIIDFDKLSKKVREETTDTAGLPDDIASMSNQDVQSALEQFLVDKGDKK